MRSALINNSTLTAIQRLLGVITIKDKNIINSDILAFEQMVEAILFFDKIVCIDDYKPEFSPPRKDYFNEIQFIKPSVFDYDYFVRKASEVTEKFIPKIQSGEIESAEFKKYFDHLKIPMIFTWDISSSVFY